MISIVLWQCNSNVWSGLCLPLSAWARAPSPVFFPQVDGSVADRLLSTRWRAGLIGRAMQSARAEKSVSLLFSLFSGKNSLFRVSSQGCTPRPLSSLRFRWHRPPSRPHLSSASGRRERPATETLSTRSKSIIAARAGGGRGRRRRGANPPRRCRGRRRATDAIPSECRSPPGIGPTGTAPAPG
jgi:hypothetical protein